MSAPEDFINQLLSEASKTPSYQNVAKTGINPQGLLTQLSNFGEQYGIDVNTLLTTSADELDRLINDVTDPDGENLTSEQRRERREERRLERRSNRAERQRRREERRQARAEGTNYSKIKKLKDQLKSTKPSFNKIIEIENEDGDIEEIKEPYIYEIKGRIIDQLSGEPIEGAKITPGVQPTIDPPPKEESPLLDLNQAATEGFTFNPNDFSFTPQPFLQKVKKIDKTNNENTIIYPTAVKGERSTTDKNGNFRILVNLPTIPANGKVPLFFSLIYTAKGYIPGAQIIINGDNTVKTDLQVSQLLDVKRAALIASAAYVEQSEKVQEYINQFILNPVEKTLALKKQSLGQLNNVVKTKLIPLAVELLIVFGITKLSQKNQKTCPAPEQLQDVVNKRNNVTRQLNQIYKSFATNVALQGAFFAFAALARSVSRQLDKIPLPQAVGTPPAKDFGGLIFAQLYSTTGKLQRLKDLIEELEEQNKELSRAILLNLAYLAAGSIVVVSLLKLIDDLSQECAEECGVTLEDQLAINEDLLDLAEEQEEDGNPVINTINGFTLSVETDDKNPVGTLKRRFAVGKDSKGITVLKGEPSFSSNEQILIDELVFYIQQNDLKAT